MIVRSAVARRRVLAPEVIQTSAMDCGPAALKCLLEAHGIPISYARLQEACQTDLDGTSINTIEQVAMALGLDAEQIMLPLDHVLLDPAHALPALVVVRRQNLIHFLVAWRRHGPLMQLMDPAKGRRWLRPEAFAAELYVHQQRVPAEGWREWAGTAEFLDCVNDRLRRLGVSAPARERLLRMAVEDSRWRSLATLDAATRMVAELARARGIGRGAEATSVIETIVTRTKSDVDPYTLVPEGYWSVLRDPTAPDDESQLIFRGAVLLRVKSPVLVSAGVGQEQERVLPSSVRRALREPRQRPLVEVWQLLKADGVWGPVLVAGALLVAAAGALLEIVLLRAFLDVGNVLSLREHRLVSVGILLAVVATLLVLDVAISSAVLRMGRRLESRLRAVLLDKLPRLSERYFHSRLVSDMAHRAHTLDAVRELPDMGARFVRTSTQLVLTAMALAWIDPPSTWVALLAAGLALLIPLATQPMLAERELRQRVHSAGLSHYYLDSLLGLTAARTHSAERALRARHEALLVEWGRSSLHFLRGSVVTEGLQMLIGSILAAWLVLDFAARGGSPGGALLLVYWALGLPALGREVAGLVRRYPAYRNVVARLLEPLAAPDETSSAPVARAVPTVASRSAGVGVVFHHVDVKLAGRTVLADVHLAIAPREHVAIVGRSGAGKSTLAGVLLGSRPPTSGRVLVDGAPLDGAALGALRRATAWVDPSVQLWNRSLFENLRYGHPESLMTSVGAVVESADLVGTLETLPDGLQSLLGEGGGLTSGGEGQRVRFGRALARDGVRLAILDEPFRGLDRAKRHDLLARAREVWRDATLLCVTHDIDETRTFGRVLVVDGGRIVEDGDPDVLANTPGSVYANLLAAEQSLARDLWQGPGWRRWRLDDGVIAEDSTEVEGPWTATGHLRGL